MVCLEGKIVYRNGTKKPNRDRTETEHKYKEQEQYINRQLSLYVDFSEKFYKYLADNKNGKKNMNGKDVLKAADTIDKLVRLDSYGFDEVKESLRWAVQDDFWSGNIRSLAALRKKSKNGESKFSNMFSKFPAQNSAGSKTSPSGTCNLCKHIGGCKGKTIRSAACDRYEGGVAL